MTTLLRVTAAEVAFPVRRGGRKVTVRALDGADLEVQAGETLAIVGESGSGKSTLARALLKLIDLTAGDIEFDGESIAAMKGRDFRPLRARLQMVFQDPYSSLNPSLRIGTNIEEPLRVHTRMSGRERAARVAELLAQVGLPADSADRYPDEFSGGQRQRIAIARALALEPDVIVCDEAVSALDVSTQNQVLALLRDLRTQRGLTYVFISHDLAVVRSIADRIAVMYLGRVVEEGPTERVYSAPAHPYTRLLLGAVPVPDPARRRRRTTVALSGELPDPANPPSGCTFRTRCPFAMAVCAEEAPAATRVDGGGSVRCHLQTSGPHLGGRPLLDLVPVHGLIAGDPTDPTTGGTPE